MFFSDQIKGLLVCLVAPCALVACGGGGGGGGTSVASESRSSALVSSSLAVPSTGISTSVGQSSSGATITSSVPNANSSVVSSVVESLSSPSSVSSSQSSIPVVIISDTTPPALSLVGADNIEINHGGIYLDGGATAHDVVDGDLSVTITGLVDTAVLGEYTLTYSATDKSGNVGSVSRVVTVVDAQSPVVTLESGEAVTVYVGDVYLDGGATAHDVVDGELPVTISGLVDTSVLGEYTLTYSATDESGNVGSVSRVVTVKSLDYGFQFVDSRLTLWEADYQHTFELVFNHAESKDRIFNVSIVETSTASEGVDFDVVSHSIVVPAHSTTANLTLAIYDDVDFEGAESIVLAFDADGFHSETLVELSDATIAGESHASLSKAYFNPMSVVMDNQLLVADSNNYEVYDLLTETTSLASSFYPGIVSGYGDAIRYQGDVYVFTSGRLYTLDMETGYSLVSESPWFMKWTSELQVLNDELYVIAGQTDVENATTQVAIYNFSSGEWKLGAPLNHIRYGAASAVVDGKIYIFGGNYGSDTAEVFDPLTNTWSYISGNSLLGGSFDTASSSGKYIDIVVSDLAGSAKVLRFDASIDGWASYTLTIPSRKFQDSFLYKGKVYFISGNDNAGQSNSVASFYIGDDAELYAD